MDQGLGGHILHDLRAIAGLRRFDRDVLARPGVAHATIMLGRDGLREPSRRAQGRRRRMIAQAEAVRRSPQASRRSAVISGTLTPWRLRPSSSTPGTRGASSTSTRSTKSLRKTDALTPITISTRRSVIPDHADPDPADLRFQRPPSPSDLGYGTMGAADRSRAVRAGLRRDPDHAARRACARSCRSPAGPRSAPARSSSPAAPTRCCRRRSASARPAPPRSLRPGSPSPICGNCAPGGRRRSRSIVRQATASLRSGHYLKMEGPRSRTSATR